MEVLHYVVDNAQHTLICRATGPLLACELGDKRDTRVYQDFVGSILLEGHRYTRCETIDLARLNPTDRGSAEAFEHLPPDGGLGLEEEVGDDLADGSIFMRQVRRDHCSTKGPPIVSGTAELNIIAQSEADLDSMMGV
jgi:hypothetical protein